MHGICFKLVRHKSGLYVCRVTREELLKQQLTDEQRKIISDCSALYNRLPSDLKTKLEGLMHVFLHEVAFEVKGFDKVTEVMRICVAAEACVLILTRGYDSYSQFRRVIIHKGLIKQGAGEWAGLGGRHEVDIKWDACLQGMHWGADNCNIILHEFAHVLDQADDSEAQSIPVSVDSLVDRRKWEEVIAREYPKIKAAYKERRAHTIDEYALASNAEFFSCATESFFERSGELHQHNPEIYELLQDYYGLDPVQWKEAEKEARWEKNLRLQKKNRKIFNGFIFLVVFITGALILSEFNIIPEAIICLSSCFVVPLIIACLIFAPLIDE